MTDKEFPVGPGWPLELPRDPAVKRNGGLDAHPGVGLEGAELSWAGQGWAWRTQEAYLAAGVGPAQDVAHGGAGSFGIPTPFLPTGI